MQQAQVTDSNGTVDDLFARFGAHVFDLQPTADNTPTLWVAREQVIAVLVHLKPRFPMLLDLFGIDERLREHKPAAAVDFTVVYHLFNLADREEIRIAREHLEMLTSGAFRAAVARVRRSWRRLRM